MWHLGTAGASDLFTCIWSCCAQAVFEWIFFGLRGTDFCTSRPCLDTFAVLMASRHEFTSVCYALLFLRHHHAYGEVLGLTNMLPCLSTIFSTVVAWITMWWDLRYPFVQITCRYTFSIASQLNISYIGNQETVVFSITASTNIDLTNNLRTYRTLMLDSISSVMPTSTKELCVAAA